LERLRRRQGFGRPAPIGTRPTRAVSCASEGGFAVDDFTYRHGSLHCESVPLDGVAEAVGTPCFVYSRATLVGHLERLQSAFAPLDPIVCFSIKSCSNLSICRLLAEHGAGMDLVSGGELWRAMQAGVHPGRCVFAGVGKTPAEIEEALAAGVGWFNVESEQEFDAISTLARAGGRSCRVALRINPDVDPHTHRYTTTGTRETKFGVDIETAIGFFRRHGGDPGCRLAGLHVHLGSPIYSTEPYVRSLRKVLELVDALESEGHRIEMLDLGGGFGADYTTAQSPTAADYAADIVPLLEPRVAAGMRIILEPGRTISANAGVLLIRVLYVKSSGTKRFVICDAGMNALLRPSHYQAFHFVWPCEVRAYQVPLRRDPHIRLPELEEVDVVGPICESGDFLAQDRAMPAVASGDLLAVFAAGAYGMSMASRYNSQPLPAEVLVDVDRMHVVRRRETYEDLTAHEMQPEPVHLRGPVEGRRPTTGTSR
jgi:diaminopimelate decarboxylase